jgi:outer membrane receptor protein involved in Fe transport
VLISAHTYSQTINCNVKGQLVDSLTNETIPYATIKVIDKANPNVQLKAVASDDKGVFHLTLNKEGEYVLSAQFLGKTTAYKEFSVKGERAIDLGAISMVDDENSLSEIVISADKPLVKVDLDKITYSMETDPESKTNNVLEMLKKVPMVTVDGDENIQLKGSSNFVIYLNGKPSNMITSNPKDVLRGMPANTVKDIEVITDPGAKYDAEGVAGIINIITQKQTSTNGYTATVSSRGDTFGGFGGGIYAMMKYGKVGFTGNYNVNRHKNPRSEAHTYRRSYIEGMGNTHLYEDGTNKSNMIGQFGSGELSFEIDTLNLINISFNRFEGRNKSYSDYLTEFQDNDYDVMLRYNRNSKGKSTFGGTGINVDYQRTFNKKDQLLTSSYRYNYNPNDSESNNNYTGVIDPTGQYTRADWQFSDANMDEHTFQLDFTTPFGKLHTIETGLKYIIRLNKSNSGYEDLDEATGAWVPREDVPENRFKHRQDIIAAYGGYSLRWNKWGFKTGLRYEATWMEARFPIKEALNFDADYSNFVPSATATYQLKPTQTLRLGYNMRISRPSIWQLNPYLNTSNLNYLQQGNSDLDPEKSHSLSLNYSFFNPKFNMNLNMSYSFGNNSIESITGTLTDGEYEGASYTTYDNIGKRKNTYLSAYINWSITDKLRLYSNLGGGYSDLKANNKDNLSNSGFTTNLYAGMQYNLPSDFAVYLNGGYFSPHISLQGKGSSFSFHNISVQKNFLNKRLSLNIYASSPFTKARVFKNTIETDTYYSKFDNQYKMRQFGIRVSFRFGELKTQIKKTKRGIVNDDVSSGNNSGQGNTQQTGGN